MDSNSSTPSYKKINLLIIIMLHLISGVCMGQNVYVDDNGVMRWEKSNQEVKGFGVNYTVPFAHAYRSALRMGVNPKEAIDNDVYHFSRLGFDLYRVHVWDTEISDTLGNLLVNENLDTFDYLIKRLKDKGINYVITPIAFWGSGWPEPDPETPGFSNRYGKGDCLTDENCIKAQQNYLYQFLNHVNPYTGLAYKDDPGLLAIEISNEPHHREEPGVVTNFVKNMVEAVDRTGTKKPIFYNVSHAVHLMDAYFKAGIDGGTFQWYPTGLGYQQEIPGNLLPNVNDYHIPFDSIIKKYNGAKLVYEFDAADVGRSYIYPAMARSFREAGIQLATHFSYDPTFIAHANTEYNTHYMNLAYTPQKALSLMICSQVFHEVPMYKNYGSYPGNTDFGNFRVSYKKDLAEYNGETKFIYTNHTITEPANEEKLQELAGYGNSPVIEYDGLGAYFLDKIDKGVWRLEVMPDAVWVDNPFGRNSPDKTVGVIKWQEHTMKVNLQDLGADIQVQAINDDNNYNPQITHNSFTIKPGTYIISRKGSRKKWNPEDRFEKNLLKDFYAPEETVRQAWYLHNAPEETTAGQPVELTVQLVTPEDPEEVQLIAYSGFTRHIADMKKVEGYKYSATIPAEKINEGYLNYYVVVKLAKDKFITYPAGTEGQPFNWNFYNREPYKVRVVSSSNPIYLFDAAKESDALVREWRRTVRLVPTADRYEDEYQVSLDKLFIPDNENLNAEPVYDYSIKHFILDNIQGRRSDLASKEVLVLKGRSLNQKSEKVQVALVLEDGSAYGKIIELEPEVNEYKIKLNDLQPVKTVTLPRPYPSFLPYFLEHVIKNTFDINKIESLQISIGPGLSKEEIDNKHGVGIRSIWLE